MAKIEQAVLEAENPGDLIDMTALEALEFALEWAETEVINAKAVRARNVAIRLREVATWIEQGGR